MTTTAQKTCSKCKITKKISSFRKHFWCKECANKCLACGKKDIKLTPDHIVPLFVGGINAIQNIQPLCLSCNISKGIKIIDFRRQNVS